ncbi:serine/threonine-protein kinase [Crocosphaera sp. XPORK-15E]|uniref:serine/threonine-protein kinase n=1 Tax=Crocosphaera sp. XPORK-15E TaxID=3110247 RepID=UPI002B1F702A|nr:serine/threonine-protein kinase [Crocosphaera sp. XPORK-15E]MEA5535405.1 serine/threonine-protein kinase [Crocosphaera sp. XPORK-15E]
MDTWLQPDATVNHRYQILRQLGQGKLGRTYLAEDRHRFKELCILQEFAPDVHDPQALQKTEELFQRKAQILYSLDHPQIPRFRELFPFKHEEKISLFLAQDYIQGLTYRQLLNERLSQGEVFSEAEVTQFLLDILPVLIYLHGKGIIHRDLTPDNIVCRDEDKLPILIDFGSVKQLSAIATTYFKQPQLLTAKILQIGQPGYAPQEQINQGIVSASSDLYGLAATALVLLTGKEPLTLIDPHTSLWSWPSEISLSDSLTHILQKMLAQASGDRYDSAQEVINALNNLTPQPTTPTKVVVNSTANSAIISQISTQEISRQSTSEIQTNMTLTSNKNSPITGCLGKLILILSLILGSGMIGWWAGKVWISQVLTAKKNPEQISIFSNEESTPKISDQELQRKTELRTRRRQLGLDQSWFVNVVDEIFGDQYPSEKGRILSNGKDDASWREKWDQTAANLLDTLEGLSAEAMQGIGSYTQNQRDSWKSQVNNLHLSSRALYDLVDGQFLSKFPEQIDQNFLDKPIGQIWSAMVLDTLTALQSGTIYEKLSLVSEFPTIEREERLEVGAGKAYVLQLNAAEKIEIKLEGDRNLLLSIYSPTGNNNLLEDSPEHQWSGELPESGYYEFTVVSKADKPVNYKLKITVSQE